MSRHRLEGARPRYARLAAAGASVAITSLALLGGLALTPQSSDVASSDTAAVGAAKASKQASAKSEKGHRIASRAESEPRPVAPAVVFEASAEVAPPGSGEGRRVVFSQADQRVWLIDDDEDVERSYLVSGSVYDNLDPGSYAVYSRSEEAWGIDDSGTMKWFVRFTEGDNAAIGFHDIPVDDGELVQTQDELGTPLSHGCIRQEQADAIALWEFAPIGTTVVVI